MQIGTKYLVIFFVIAALGGGLVFFQKHRQRKDIQTHRIQQLKRVKKVAKKSNYAGLLVMASAINNFHKKKGHYPKNLLLLYPDFIPDKSFISELTWEYHPGIKDFLLKKSMGNGKAVASIGPDLKLRQGDDISTTSAQMVASASKSKISQQPAKKIKSNSSQLSGKKTIVNKVSENKPGIEKNKKSNQLVKLSSQNLMEVSVNKISSLESRPFKSDHFSNIIQKSLSKNEKYLLSLNSNNFYIWKSKDGFIGFSNVRYPDEKNLTIYKNQNWIQYTE